MHHPPHLIKGGEIKNKNTDLFVCWKVVFFKINFGKVNSEKVNNFPMFGRVIKNKLENNLQCFVMLWKMSYKITY